MKAIETLTERNGFRQGVAAMIARMAELGEPARVFEGLRTVEQQREKVSLGYSNTLASAHLPGPDGLSKAADVAHASRGWNADRRFWLIVGSYALFKGWNWGGLYGLTTEQKRRLKAAILELRRQGWPAKSPLYAHKLGWDPAHVSLERSNWPK